MALNFETEGVIHKIGPVQEISDTFKKREIVIIAYDNPMYKEHPTFELVQEGCDLVDGMSEGDSVSIRFNIRGKEYKDKDTGEVRYITTLRAWKITKTYKTHNESPLPF